MNHGLYRQAADPLRSQQGFGFVSILLALLIAAVLYFGYFQFQGATNERKATMPALDAARGVACRSNRQTVERAIIAYAAMHGREPQSLAALEKDGIHIPKCPEGGTYELAGREVHCSKHP